MIHMSFSGFVEAAILYLTADFPFSAELQAFWMAFQGAMAVRNGPNRDRSMHWFHAFMLSVVSGYGGAAFTPLWMGKATSMLSNDMNMAACITTFCLVNYSPFDIGYRLGNTLPVTLVTTTFSQLFRSMGVCKFTNVAFEEFRHNPSPYYPIPVFGPIAYGTLLGNMSGFFVNGFNGHLRKGMPWPFQNGLFCCTLYHFFVHDAEGPIGHSLRKFVHSLPGIQGKLDDKTFALVCVGIFMQIIGILQMRQFFGSAFSPFNLLPSIPLRLWEMIPKAKVDRVPEGAPNARDTTPGAQSGPTSNGLNSFAPELTLNGNGIKKKRNRRKKNKVKET